MGVAAAAFYVVNGHSWANHRFWFEVAWYPLAFATVAFWLKAVRRVKLADYALGRPRWPEEGHRWFYVLYVTLWVAAVLALAVAFARGWAVLETPVLAFLVGLVHSCVGAPVVEEFLFRGYVYERARDVWGDARWQGRWESVGLDPETGQEVVREVATFQVTRAALVSSLAFGAWHLNPFKAFYTFFGGLFFCKTRNEWGRTLVAPALLHASWNFVAHVVASSRFTFLEGLFTWLADLF